MKNIKKVILIDGLYYCNNTLNNSMRNNYDNESRDISFDRKYEFNLKLYVICYKTQEDIIQQTDLNTLVLVNLYPICFAMFM